MILSLIVFTKQQNKSNKILYDTQIKIQDYEGFKDSSDTADNECECVGAGENTIGVRDTLDAALKPVCRYIYAALNTRVCTYVYATWCKRPPHSKRAAQTKAYIPYTSRELSLSLSLFVSPLPAPASSRYPPSAPLSFVTPWRFFFLLSFSPLLPLYPSQRLSQESALILSLYSNEIYIFRSVFLSFFPLSLQTSRDT